MPVGNAVKISLLGPEIFRLAVEACPSGIIVVDSDGAIAMINNEVERLFGIVAKNCSAGRLNYCCLRNC